MIHDWLCQCLVIHEISINYKFYISPTSHIDVSIPTTYFEHGYSYSLLSSTIFTIYKLFLSAVTEGLYSVIDTPRKPTATHWLTLSTRVFVCLCVCVCVCGFVSERSACVRECTLVYVRVGWVAYVL